MWRRFFPVKPSILLPFKIDQTAWREPKLLSLLMLKVQIHLYCSMLCHGICHEYSFPISPLNKTIDIWNSRKEVYTHHYDSLIISIHHLWKPCVNTANIYFLDNGTKLQYDECLRTAAALNTKSQYVQSLTCRALSFSVGTQIHLGAIGKCRSCSACLIKHLGCDNGVSFFYLKLVILVTGKIYFIYYFPCFI